MIVWRRDLHHVHSDQFGPQRDFADRPQQVRRLHAARLGRPRSRREPGIEDVDVDRQVNELRTIQRFLDRLLDDRLDAAIEEFAHQVPAHPLGAHPLECLAFWPIAAQADLYEVAAQDRSRLDQPAHRGGVRGEVSPAVATSVRMGVEVDHRELAAAVSVGDRGRGWVRDRVIASNDDRHDLARGDFGDPGADRLVRLVRAPRIADGIAVVDDRENLEGRDLEIEVPAGRLVVCHSHRPRPEAGARPVCRAVVPGGADDRNVRSQFVELGRLGQHPDFHEGGRTQVLRAIDLSLKVGRLWHSPTILAAPGFGASTIGRGG